MSKTIWVFILAMAFFGGCTPKLNDGIIPTQAAYTGTHLPNPLVIYNGTLSAGVSVAVYLPSPYNAAITLNYGDTSVTPVEGNANLLLGVTNYNPTGNVVPSTFVAYGMVPVTTTANPGGILDLSSGGYSQAIFDAMVTGPVTGVTETLTFQAAGGPSSSVAFVTPSAWMPQTLTLPANQTNVTQLFVVTFANSPTNLAPAPVTLYIDNLYFQ